MGSLTDLLQPGVAAGWLLLPNALLLGVLHGLEPGHSRTMMTAFIIAVRGTIGRAVLLGLAATVSHTAVVWVSAIIGVHFGGQYDGAFAEPYLQVVSAAMIIAVALWMLGRTRREQCTCGPQEAGAHITIPWPASHSETLMSWLTPMRSGASSSPET